MGTSTPFSGPRGGPWAVARRRLTRWQQAGCPVGGTERVAEGYRSALAAAVQDRDALGIRVAATAAGGRLVETLEAVSQSGWDAVGRPRGATIEERLDFFLVDVVGRVAGPGGLIADAVVRRAALAAARTLVGDDRLRTAVTDGRGGGLSIPDGLFCAVFGTFFTEIIRQFVAAVVSEKVMLGFPLLTAVDPAGVVADWVGANVASLVPNPCAERERQGTGGQSLTDLAHDLVAETVEQALGVEPSGEDVAA